MCGRTFFTADPSVLRRMPESIRLSCLLRLNVAGRYLRCFQRSMLGFMLVALLLLNYSSHCVPFLRAILADCYPKTKTKKLTQVTTPTRPGANPSSKNKAEAWKRSLLQRGKATHKKREIASGIVLRRAGTRSTVQYAHCAMGKNNERQKTVCAVTFGYITVGFGFSCFAFFLGLDQSAEAVKTVSRKDYVSSFEN